MAHWTEHWEKLSRRLTQRLRYALPEQDFTDHEAGISFKQCCKICDRYEPYEVWYVIQHSRRSSGEMRFQITYSRDEYYISCPARSHQHVPEVSGSASLSYQQHDHGNSNICLDVASGAPSDVVSFHQAASNLLDFLETTFSWLYQQIDLPDVVTLQTFVANWRQVPLYHGHVSPDPDRQECLQLVEDDICSLQLAFLPPHSIARFTNHSRRDAVDIVWRS